MTFEKTSILSVFIKQAAKYPSNVAIEDGSTVFTFDELLNQVERLSPLVWRHLAKLSLSPESRFVCVLLPQSHLFLQSTLAVFGAGGICVPFGIDSTPAQLDFMLADLGYPLLLTVETILQEKKFVYDNCLILSNESQDDIHNSQLNDFTFQENEFAYAFFTSGSTGQPKAALHRHRTILNTVQIKQAKMSLSSDDKSCLFINPAFCLATQEMWSVLLVGGRLVVAPPYLRHDVRELRKWVKEADISLLTLVTSTAAAFFTQMTHLNEFSQSLRWVCCGGESLHKIPPEGLPFSVWLAYGATETIEIAYNILHSGETFGHFEMGKIPVGGAIDGYDILIVSEELEVVPDGVSGEVCVAGEHLGSYVNREELMAQKFVSICGQRAYRTGDLGYKNADGVLFLVDRMDNVVKLSGHKFEVGDLERILCQHPLIHKAVAVVQKNGVQPKLHAFYTLKTEMGMEDLQEKLYDFLKDKIPYYAHPATFCEIQTIPLNSNGKIDKKQLLILLSEIENKKIETLETRNEKKLVEIWSTVLRIPTSKIRTNENFFGLGGSSIQIGIILDLIKTSCCLPNNVELTPAKFFAHPTIQAFSFYLDHSEDGELKNEVNRVNFSEEMATYESLIKKIVLPKVESKYRLNEGGILLTGATGYLGSSLLVRLLEKYPSRSIYCLVRANSPNDAEKRILDSMKKFGISPPNVRPCVFLPGNISRPLLGLDEEDYNGLSQSIGEIFHAAAEVHFLKDYESLKASNIQGVIEILKFASQSRLKVLHYMSTLGIFGFLRNSVDGIISENVVSEINGNEMGYDQTKSMAENIVLMGKEKGIPTRIFRVGIIGPHSKEKIANPNDFLLLMLQASILLHASPTLDWKFPFTTLDFAVEAILTLSACPFEEDDLKTFHILQKEVTLEETRSILANGRQMKLVIPSHWMTLLLKVGESNSQLQNLIQVLSTPMHEGLTFLQLPHNRGWNIKNNDTLRAIKKCKSENIIFSDEFIINSIADSLNLNLK